MMADPGPRLARILAELTAQVRELEVERAAAASSRRAQRVSGVDRDPGASALERVLLMLCGALGDPLAEAASRARRGPTPVFSRELLRLCREQCRAEPAMLGPLYEGLARRAERYAQGQYFTPPALAVFMAGLVSAFGAERVLDPAVGAGALLSELDRRVSVTGFDLSPTCLSLARTGLALRGFADVTLQRGDFLRATSHGSFDAVLANPPYLRHHLLAPAQKRALAGRYGARFGVTFSTLSTSYVYFFAAALERLRPGGLLVFLTPADFLDTRFGSGLKELLVRHTELVDLILFDRDQLAFDGVLTTSVVTVARKRVPRTASKVRFAEAGIRAGAVIRAHPVRRAQRELSPEQRWSSLFGARHDALTALVRTRPKQLSDYLRVRRGIATGANDFFLLSEEARAQWGIEPEFLAPVIASARDLPDGKLTQAHVEELKRRGRKVWLLSVRHAQGELAGTNVLRYLRHGEARGVHLRFNCRTRRPWYRPENVPPPHLIITYMNRSRVRFVANEARCLVMSAFLNGFFVDPTLDAEALLAALSSEETASLLRMVSRRYGGGLTKIEPRELAALPMPNL